MLLPSGVTLAGLFFALWAIVEISDGNLVRGAWLIWTAALIDLVDGGLARAMGAITAFGKDLDSLVDFASAGVAPAFLLHTAQFSQWGWIGFFPPFVWACFVAARLARFNTTDARYDEYFQGIPSPPAATSVIHFFLFSTATFGTNGNPYVSLFLIVTIGPLMLSNVRYEKARWLAPKRVLKNHYGIGTTLMVVMIPFFPRQSVFVAVTYSIYGVLIRHLYRREGPLFG